MGSPSIRNDRVLWSCSQKGVETSSPLIIETTVPPCRKLILYRKLREHGFSLHYCIDGFQCVVLCNFPLLKFVLATQFYVRNLMFPVTKARDFNDVRAPTINFYNRFN